MGVSKTLNGGITYGQLMSYIIQQCGRTNEQAQIELDWYDGEVPEFMSLQELIDFAVAIDAAWHEDNSPEV